MCLIATGGSMCNTEFEQRLRKHFRHDVTLLAIELPQDTSLTDTGIVGACLPAMLTQMYLNFKSNKHFTDKGLRTLAAGISPTLKRLLLDLNSNTKFTDVGLHALAERTLDNNDWRYIPK